MKKNHCKIHGEMDTANAYECKNPNGTIRLRCKECARIQAIKRYGTERQVAIDRASEWKKNNRELINARVKQDRALNPIKYRKWANDHYNKNPEKYLDRTISWNRGITKEEYYEIIKSQNNLCAICNQPEARLFKGKLMRLCLDHDHKTGAIRSLLCHACNTGIGKFKDSIELLQSAIAYLTHHDSK